MYIETSAPRRPNDNAILQSATFGANTQQCLHFWYFMFGNTIGSLNVWVKPQTGNATKVWELKGQQGVQWLQGQVAVSSTQSYQVQFHEHTCILTRAIEFPVSKKNIWKKTQISN